MLPLRNAGFALGAEPRFYSIYCFESGPLTNSEYLLAVDGANKSTLIILIFSISARNRLLCVQNFLKLSASITIPLHGLLSLSPFAEIEDLLLIEQISACPATFFFIIYFIDIKLTKDILVTQHTARFVVLPRCRSINSAQ